MKYKELIYEGKTYTEQYDIEEILVKEGMSWFIDAETENVRIEIQNKTLIFNGGIWFNGIWKYGAFRNGEWKFGVWENGVFFNGVWRDGTWHQGIIFNGKFFQGTFMNGKIRTSDQKGVPTKQEFIDCELTNIKKMK